MGRQPRRKRTSSWLGLGLGLGSVTLTLTLTLTSSLLSPSFSPQRDLGTVSTRETRVLLHEAMVGMQRTQPRKWGPRKPKLQPTTWCVFSDILMICSKRSKGGGRGEAAAGKQLKCRALLPLLHIAIDPMPGTDVLTLHRRLPLAPGGKREGAVAYEWECHCGSEMIMLGLVRVRVRVRIRVRVRVSRGRR